MEAVFNLRIAGLYHANSILHGVESRRKGAAGFSDAAPSNLRQLTLT